MRSTDVIIVGGGPAGSSCAWRLQKMGIDCLVLDQHPFPRFKPCAGWITPEVMQILEFQVSEYPLGIKKFSALYFSIRGVSFKMPTRQYAIRRTEFDDWLLRRSAAPVIAHQVKTIEESPDGYIVDGQFCGKYIVGAGGTYCPVYRTLFKAEIPKDRGTLIAAMEDEFPYDYSDESCRLWFLDNRLPGYSWYVPKANGWLNIGVGGKAEEIKANGDNLKDHWNFLVEKLDQQGLVKGHDYKPSAHSYYLNQKVANPRKGNAFIIGDAAGLATLDMGEGISAAIRSGVMAAEAIANNRPYSLGSIPKYSTLSILRHAFAR